MENRVSRNDSIKKEKIIDELQQLLTSTEKEMSDAPLEITTSPSSEEEDLEEEVEEEEATTQSESEDPSPMGLTSDHEKRANPAQDNLDFPQDDGETSVHKNVRVICRMSHCLSIKRKIISLLELEGICGLLNSWVFSWYPISHVLIVLIVLIVLPSSIIICTGTFVIVVVGITLCAIAGVVGVGCFLHRPSCPRPPSPFSDCSPTFQSAKLAFSSSPEEKVNNSQQFKR